MYKSLFLSLSSVLLLTLFSLAQVPLGSGSYNPNGPGPSTNEGPYLSQEFDQRVMTSDWWTSLLWSKWQSPSGFSNAMHPHPFSVRAGSSGLEISHNQELTVYNGNVGTSFDNVYNSFFQADLSVGLEGISFGEAVASEYGDWDVEALWKSGVDQLRARMGHGFTFVYFTKSGSRDVRIQTSGTGEVQGSVLVIEREGQTFAVFAPTGATWTGQGGVFTSNLAGKDYWSVALLPDDSQATLEAFQATAFTFVQGTTVSYEFTNNGNDLVTEFNLALEAKEGVIEAPYMALYRHQWLYSEVNTDWSYDSPRGEMKVQKGKGFSITMPVIGSIPVLPVADHINIDALGQLVKAFADRPVYNCQGVGCNWGYYGNYTMGRFLIQAGQVALIADEIGDKTSRDKIVNWIKTELEDYFTYSGASDIRHIAYNDHWDISLINSDNIEHASIQFLNDRNLQYGYWIRAAAIVAKFHEGWADDDHYGPIIDLLIRCVANENREDAQFPFMRNFDPYAGHSWAHGPSDLADGADQESSSESLNFASALIYYGQVTHRPELVKRGQWIYTTEVVGTEQYWFDVDEVVFPSTFQPEMLGIVRSSGGFYQLWWELRPEHVLMVNCFPWTGGALYLGRHPEACERVFNWISTGAGQNGIQKWQGYLWPYEAFFNPDKALQEFQTFPYDYSLELEAEANNYLWLHSLAEKGQVAKDITSNSPSAVAFTKNGSYNYAIYNPEDEIMRVEFSTGDRFDVPAGALLWFDEEDHVTVNDCAGEPDGEAMIDVCGNCAGGTTGILPTTDSAQCITSITTSRQDAFQAWFSEEGTSIYLEPGSFKTGTYHLALWSTSGELVLRTQLTGLNESVPLPKKPSPGLYVLEITNSEERVTQKLYQY